MVYHLLHCLCRGGGGARVGGEGIWKREKEVRDEEVREKL